MPQAQPQSPRSLTDLSSLPLPDPLRLPLARLRDALLEALGDRLHALVVYGSVARGRYRQGESDVNVMVVLRQADIAALNAIAAPLRDALHEFAADPLVLARDELPGAAKHFPTKFLEIRRYHVVLHGADPFHSLPIPRQAILHRIEQEICNLMLRLRRRYVAICDDDGLVIDMLRDNAVPLSVSLLGLLEVKGSDGLPDKTRAAIFRRASEVFGLDRNTLEDLDALRHGRPAQRDAPALFAATLALLERAVEIPATLADENSAEGQP